MTDTEDLLRAALAARARRYAAPPDAWARNRARLRRRARTRRITWTAAAAAAAGVGAVAAAALPRATAPPSLPPVRPASASGTPSHALHEPDLHGMPAADARTLAAKCVAAYLEPVQELPDERLLAPPESYELIFALPAARTTWATGDVVALRGRDHVVMCSGTVTSPGMAHWTLGRRAWLTDPVDGGFDHWGGDRDEWRASGRYTADVVRIEAFPVKNGPGVPVVMDNGVWFAAAYADGPVVGGTRGRGPRVAGYDAAGRLVYDSDLVPTADCYLVAGERVDSLGEPTAETDCVKPPAWP